MAGQVPYVSYLRLGDDPHLVANSCSSCGALFFDRRNACASCGARDFGSRRLANSGVLRAFTIVHRASPGVQVPYVSGIVDLDGGGVVKANIVGVDPAPGADVVNIGDNIAAQRESEREDMLGNRIECVIPDVGHNNAMRLGVGFVDDVGARRGHRDQFEIGQLREDRLAQRHFVDDGDGRVAQPIDDFLGRGDRIFLVAVRKSRRPHIGFKC